jgi:hypothetical protein
MLEPTKKRTLEAFFKPPPKKARLSDDGQVLKDEETNLQNQVSYLR